MQEMVFIQPTLNCLVNLTESPFFCCVLDKVDHVHFERVSFSSKTYDIVLVNTDFTKQPWRVDMVQNTTKDAIQEWLTDMDLPYTEGPMNLNWKQIMATIVEDDRFYMDTEEDDVTPKEAGWEFLRMQEGGVLDKVDHVHFERVSFSSKTYDIVLVNTDFTKQPWRVDMVQNTTKDAIQEWLTDMDLPYTEGPMNLNWKQIMATIVEDDRFYMDTEEDDVTPKEAGWEFLRMQEGEEGSGDDDGDESDFSIEEGEESSSEEDNDDSDASSFATESEEDSDFDGDEELEEGGMDWEEMEAEAKADDKKRAREAQEQDGRASNKKRR